MLLLLWWLSLWLLVVVEVVVVVVVVLTRLRRGVFVHTCHSTTLHSACIKFDVHEPGGVGPCYRVPKFSANPMTFSKT